MFNKIDHIGIAVSDLETGKAFWEGALGLESRGEETVEGEGVKVAFYEAELEELLVELALTNRAIRERETAR